METHLVPILISLIFSIVAYFITRATIKLATPLFIAKGLTGRDLLKRNRPILPESMGTIVGCIYFVFMFLFIPVPFLEWSILRKETAFPHELFAQYLGGLLSLFSMLFLGFADDILDIRWRVKIWFPFIASIPLLMVYYVTYGNTDVLVPLPLRVLFKSTIVHLGSFYYLFLSCLCVFSTNGINILAGANGIEAIQPIVISISLVINTMIQLNANLAKSEALMNTLYFLFPYIGASLGFISLNWYPATAFGGDTFCYFSGMGILGNLSKTVLLFMMPQMFNFLYSCPQLFHFVECPRHRMPQYLELTRLSNSQDAIEYSTFKFKQPKGMKDKMGRHMIRFLEVVGLAHITRNKKGDWLECNNLTLLNLVLVKMGPMNEGTLAWYICAIQVLGSCTAFFIRYGLVHIVYN